MKKTLCLLLCVCLTLSLLAGCGSEASGGKQTNQPTEKIVIRIANDQADDHPKSVALADFEKEVEEASGGVFDVQVYNNNLLGGEEVYTDACIKGEIEMCMPGITLANIYQPWACLEIPFLFSDFDMAAKVFSDEWLTDELFADMPEACGLRHLGYAFLGFRCFGSVKPLESMEDLKGLRFRTNSAQSQMAFATNLGANPVPIAFSELFSAMEQKAADAYEIPLPTIYTSKFYEPVDYVILSRHILGMGTMNINENFFQSLTPEQQKIIIEAGRHFQENCIKYNKEYEQQVIDAISADNTTVLQPSEEFLADMKAAEESYKDLVIEMYPGAADGINKIIEIAGKYQ